jgi:hypothetical protein
MQRPWLLLSLLALASCSSGVNTTLQVSNYDTACTADADCKAVFIGDPCATKCQCPNAAINSVDVPREQSDLMAVAALCTSSPGVCTASCIQPTPACTAGHCTLP